jgi:hypothetical protein
MATYPSQYAPIPTPDLENWNLDRSVTPPTMVRGCMHRTSAGSWDYDVGQPATDDTLQSVAGFNIPAYDYVSRSWVAGTFTETWTFKTGGSSGDTVGTITIVYDDVNMSNIVSVTKT